MAANAQDSWYRRQPPNLMMSSETSRPMQQIVAKERGCLRLSSPLQPAVRFAKNVVIASSQKLADIYRGSRAPGGR